METFAFVTNPTEKIKYFFECWTAKESLFKLTGHGPLLSLSAFALPRGVVLDHILQNGCTVTVAMDLNK